MTDDNLKEQKAVINEVINRLHEASDLLLKQSDSIKDDAFRLTYYTNQDTDILDVLCDAKNYMKNLRLIHHFKISDIHLMTTINRMIEDYKQ